MTDSRQKSDHLEPASSVIARMGGVAEVASICGKTRSQVYRWMWSKERGGTGGLIPQSEAVKLIGCARKAAIELEPADFFPPTDAAA